MKTIFLLLLFVAGVARADAPTTQWTTGTSSGQAFLGTYYVDKASACSALNSKVSGQVMQSAPIWTFTGSIVTGGGNPTTQCYLGLIRTDGSGGTSWSGYNYSSKSLCSNGADPDTTKPLAQQCPGACPAAGVSAGTQSVTTGWATGPNSNSPIAKKVVPDGGLPSARWSDGSCQMQGTNPHGCSQESTATTGGYYRVYCMVDMSYTGQSSVPGPSNSDTLPSDSSTAPTTPSPGVNKCPSGTVSGGIDSAGIPICMGVPNTTPTTTTTTVKPPVTTPNGDGSTTTVNESSSTNGDGSTTTTTTTTTTNADGTASTTTATSTKNADGTNGKKDLPESDLCKLHPELNICQNSTIAGTCENVTCNGDAIQCAIARQQAKDSCKLKADEDAVKASSYHATGVAALAGTGNAGLPNPANAESISVGSLDSSGWLGGGNCLADKTISTSVGSFVIPLSEACDVLILFRYLFMFVASMISFRILSNAFLGG